MILFSSGIFLQNVFADQVVATIGVNPPSAIAINPFTNIIYTSPGRNVDVIDGTSNNLLTSIVLPSSSGYNPGIDVNPNTNMVYVSDGKNHLIYVINSISNTVAGTIQVGTGPADVAVNPVTNTIYVANSGNLYNLSGKVGPTSISIINGSTNSVISTIPTAGWPFVKVNPVTNLVYVNDGNGTISVLDGSSNNVVSQIQANGYGEMAINQVTNMIYVTNYTDSGTVPVIDGSTNRVVTTISGIPSVFEITVDSNTNKIYVPNPNGDGQDNATVTVIDGSTNNIESKIPIPYSSTAIAANSVTDKIYLGISGNSVTDPGIYVIQSSSSTTSQLTINSQDNNGNPITGFFTTLSQDGNQVDTGFTPASFLLNNAQTYTVNVSSFGKYVFDHWLDTGATDPTRDISITSDDTITAVYKTVPQQPTNLVATAKILKINLSWNAPTDNGGSAITGYMIERSTDNGSTWATLVTNTDNTGTTYSDSNVSPLKTYTYRVSAINDVGTSDPSNTASATTPTVGPITPPSLP